MNGTFIQLVIAFIALSGLFWGIFTSTASEAIKLFAFTLVAVGVVIIYLFFLEQRIKKLEGVKLYDGQKRHN